MRFTECPIAGCLRVAPEIFEDARGRFVKTFRRDAFRDAGIDETFAEHFVTESAAGVLRGMHFQLPPHDHGKLVTCVRGKVLDVVVDLRGTSATCGRHHAFELDGARFEGVYVPRGLAHGFLVLEGPAVMHYATSTVHAPSHDRGIRWDTFGFRWPVERPTLSERDGGFPALPDFASPF